MAHTVEPQVQVSSACSPCVLFRPLAKFEILISSPINLCSVTAWAGYTCNWFSHHYLSLPRSLREQQWTGEGWGLLTGSCQTEMKAFPVPWACQEKVLYVNWGDIDIPDCQVLNQCQCRKNKTIFSIFNKWMIQKTTLHQ